MRVVCRDKNNRKHILLSMMDVDVGDQRTTISLSGASKKIINPSEAKVVWWTQANYMNDSHNNNANANAIANDNDNDNDNANDNANVNANSNDNANANNNANDNVNDNDNENHNSMIC
jgi:hypothetical protein